MILLTVFTMCWTMCPMHFLCNDMGVSMMCNGRVVYGFIWLVQEKWEKVAPMSVARAGVKVAAVNGLLYAVGGRVSSRDFSAPVTVDSVEIYDPHLDTWTEVGNMITSRCDGGVAVL